MARVLFTTFGSYGDLFPFIAAGVELGRRGHAVTIATSEAYRTIVESAGLAFHPVRPDIDMEDRALIAQYFDARRGTERVVRDLCSYVRQSYEDTLPVARRADVIVTHLITFGAAAVAQKLGIPWISAVLAPSSFLSAEEPAVPAPAPWLVKLRIFGPGVIRFLYRFARSETLRWMQEVVRFRSELGLSPAHPLFEGGHSPRLILALFSRYLTSHPPDWPPNTAVTGFPFYDQPEPLPADLQQWLAEGPAPVVFTLGSSAVGAAGSFYNDSLDAARKLGVRALFLTGSQPENRLPNLPATVRDVPYAPHVQVFRHAAAIVHQGGIGTTAQAMRAGKPMLVVPFAHDQFDNGERVRRLGAAEVLPRSRYTAARAAQAIAKLMAEPSYAEAAAALGERVRAENGSTAASDAIEAFLAGGCDFSTEKG